MFRPVPIGFEEIQVVEVKPRVSAALRKEDEPEVDGAGIDIEDVTEGHRRWNPWF